MMAGDELDHPRSALEGALLEEAVAMLGEPAPRSALEMRARLLDRLDEAQWAPSMLGFQAARRLVDAEPAAPASVVYPLLLREVERKLSAAVREFSEQFFTIAPAERRRRWGTLLAECEFSPPLCLRLRRLQPGLTVQIGSDALQASEVSTLTSQLGQLFVLPEAQRCALRESLLADMRSNCRRWQDVARWLQIERPEIAGLDPQFIQTARTLTVKPPAVVKRRRPAPSMGGKKPAWNWAWLIAVGVMVIGRLISSSSTNSTYRPPAYDRGRVSAMLKESDALVKSLKNAPRNYMRPWPQPGTAGHIASSSAAVPQSVYVPPASRTAPGGRTASDLNTNLESLGVLPAPPAANASGVVLQIGTGPQYIALPRALLSSSAASPVIPPGAPIVPPQLQFRPGPGLESLPAFPPPPRRP